MNVESLKNYGRPFSDTMTALPGALQKRIRSAGAKVIRKHVGLLGMLRLLLLTWREERRMRRVDLAPFGLRFVRTRTLGRKGEHCDFRFERVS